MPVYPGALAVAYNQALSYLWSELGIPSLVNRQHRRRGRARPSLPQPNLHARAAGQFSELLCHPGRPKEAVLRQPPPDG